MKDLFTDIVDENQLKFAPLADLARPKTLAEVVGQKHLLAEGKPLYEAFKGGVPHSMIFWGPPGVGKTTLANLIANEFDAEFISLSAVFSGVKEIREAIKEAEGYRLQGRRTILFIDEIHTLVGAGKGDGATRCTTAFRRVRTRDFYRCNDRKPLF